MSIEEQLDAWFVEVGVGNWIEERVDDLRPGLLALLTKIQTEAVIEGERREDAARTVAIEECAQIAVLEQEYWRERDHAGQASAENIEFIIRKLLLPRPADEQQPGRFRCTNRQCHEPGVEFWAGIPRATDTNQDVACPRCFGVETVLLNPSEAIPERPAMALRALLNRARNEKLRGTNGDDMPMYQDVILTLESVLRDRPTSAKPLWACPACDWADASSCFERDEGDPCPRCKTPIVVPTGRPVSPKSEER